MADTSVKFEWVNTPEQIANRIFNDDLMMFAIQTWWNLSLDFVPMDTGNLSVSSVNFSTGTVDGMKAGIMEHNTVYGKRLYYNPQFNFQTGKHGHAGGMWGETPKAAGKAKELGAAVQKRIDS